MADERAASAVDKQIGERVRARRLEIGMSQEQLAGLLGITFQQVQKYEKGVNRIAASRLFDMSYALDMPVSAFFEGLRAKAGTGERAGDVFAALMTPGASDLLQRYAAIKNTKLRRRVLELVKAMDEEV